MIKLLYVSPRKIRSKDKEILEEVKKVLLPYEELEYEVLYEKDFVEKLRLETDKDIEEQSIYEALKGKQEQFDWVHVRLTSSDWRKLGIRSSLWGQHRTVNNKAITYGRWTSRRNKTKDIEHEYPYLGEHALGMIHEYLHSKEGLFSKVHSFLYGYSRLYMRWEEKLLKPKRYAKKPSLKALLDSVYGSVTNEKPEVDTPVVSDKKKLYKPKNFSISELVPPNVLKRLGEEKCWQLFDERLLKNLQWLRDRFGVTYVNNGTLTYRGFDDGGFRKHGTSQHNHGRAVDCHFKDYTIAQVHDILKKEHINMLEPNIWVEATHNGKPITWLHLDVRYSDKKGLYFFNA